MAGLTKRMKPLETVYPPGPPSPRGGRDLRDESAGAVCGKRERSVFMLVWPLGEGAAKPGIEMARRDIMQQKRKEQDVR